jgi:hypothetical protein
MLESLAYFNGPGMKVECWVISLKSVAWTACKKVAASPAITDLKVTNKRG